MKYQFKEGDGSHRDMTIEQCNIVLDRLRNQGYSVWETNCIDKYPHFWTASEEFYRVVSTNHGSGILHNQIPFERWMEILDQNELEETANDFADLDRSISISPSIKEHQQRCKSFIEYINMDSDTFVKKMQYSYDVEAQQKAIIAEMKEVLTHIPDNKLAGYPEKLRKLAEKLTKL